MRRRAFASTSRPGSRLRVRCARFPTSVPSPALPFDMQVLAEAVADIGVARLGARLNALARTRRPRGGDTRLLSLRGAARRLGVSRGRTLPDLIGDRHGLDLPFR